METKAVIFDMDGLMFDTENLVRRSWDAAGAALGYENFGNNILNTLGKGERDRKLYFAEKYGQDFPYDKFKEDYRRFFWEEIEKNGVPVKPGLFELLKYLKEREIPAAVATSSSRESAMDKLARTGTEPYFKAVIGGDMVARTKPDPEIYQTACRMLGVRPEEALVLEDSLNGLKAAVAAKIPAVMIPDIISDLPEIEPFLAAKLSSLKQVIEFLEQLSHAKAQAGKCVKSLFL